jgi:hypothetical protein
MDPTFFVVLSVLVLGSASPGDGDLPLVGEPGGEPKSDPSSPSSRSLAMVPVDGVCVAIFYW